MNSIHILIAVFSLFLGALRAENYFEELSLDAWEDYKSSFGKFYTTEFEEQFRMEILKETRQKIAKHNLEYEQGKVSYEMGINQFSDLLYSEFIEQFTLGNNFVPHSSNKSIMYLPVENVQLPDTVDWRSSGWVTGVKNQGACGSCWTFAATGTLEGQWKRKTGSLVSLSEQTFLDCVTSPRYHSSGCNGGWTQEALDFAKNFGVEAEASYPYKTKQETCTFTANNIVLKGTGEVRIESGNAEALKNAVATQGPISVVLYASSKFQSYKSGVYYEPNCSKQCNHAVLAVGYGNEGGQDYWLLKNSWATWFGEAGYIKLARNKDNMCGILTDSHYPLV